MWPIFGSYERDKSYVWECSECDATKIFSYKKIERGNHMYGSLPFLYAIGQIGYITFSCKCCFSHLWIVRASAGNKKKLLYHPRIRKGNERKRYAYVGVYFPRNILKNICTWSLEQASCEQLIHNTGIIYWVEIFEILLLIKILVYYV